jgi:hypothetical protein
VSEALARLLKTDVRLSPPEGSADLPPPSPPANKDQNVSYGVSWSRYIFWTKAAATFGDLLICAKNLLIEATQVKNAERDGGTPIVSGGSEKVVS